MQRTLNYRGFEICVDLVPTSEDMFDAWLALKDRLTARQWRSQASVSRFAVARFAIADLISLRRSLTRRQSM
jgi:hypothetical protein